MQCALIFLLYYDIRRKEPSHVTANVSVGLYQLYCSREELNAAPVQKYYSPTGLPPTLISTANFFIKIHQFN